MKLVQMPRGAETVCHGHEVYVVSNRDWTVELPDHIAAFMVQDGRSGAIILPDPEPETIICPACGHTFTKEDY